MKNLIKTHLFSRFESPKSEGFEAIGPFLSQAGSRPAVTPSLAVPFVATTLSSRLAHAALAVPAPVKAVAAMSAKSGVAGAIVDSALAGVYSIGPLSRGEVKVKQVTLHVLSEGACGFLTAGAGTAGSISAYMITGSLGPIVIASGMASSMAVRWGYRQIVGETLPTPETQDPSDDSAPFQNIGPKK